ncbi:DUF4395 domain-containing protein [Actinoalloteichus hymeniacidonis]|uniref:DUF4395 family protein n=1 Tax=Actinoalloteichus hymeniacidonis TaxID=340345 RepID=A0AAC9N106_9PSEU|nr:DUF4395 domain-containing protein [Actinoalloteichus hymeniacidonis]AOS65955.1 putative DUF4395 family protein [Actinoalloteichus hymeniacidonis]MBB5905949.1 hypothetical protein [Actinoalloteichus hymeniacidonis]
MPDKSMIDARGARFSAAMTSVILVVVLLTGSWRLLAAQLVLFGLCAFVGLRLNPWGVVYRRWVRPRLTGPVPREQAAPVQFSQGVGFVFSAIGVIGYASGLTVLGVTATALALVAALLNAVFGLCLGCELYLLIQRFRSIRSAKSA